MAVTDQNGDAVSSLAFGEFVLNHETIPSISLALGWGPWSDLSAWRQTKLSS